MHVAKKIYIKFASKALDVVKCSPRLVEMLDVWMHNTYPQYYYNPV